MKFRAVFKVDLDYGFCMPNIIRDFHKDTFYHVYNRGFNKQLLFYTEEDYQRFVFKIAVYKKKFPSIEIKAYCLLPNHFHFLLEDKSTKAELQNSDSRSTLISAFMKGLQLSHAMYFTKKYKDLVKNGLKSPIYEGRFCSKPLLNEAYLENVKNYIDFNAWRHAIVSDPADWPYSSYHWVSRSTLNLDESFKSSDFSAELEF